MDYIVIFGIIIATLVVFQIGRWSRSFKIARLKKENQMLRNLLSKILHLEELNAQTYSKIVQEYTRTNNKPQ